MSEFEYDSKKIEYYYDKDGNKYELGSGFKDIPGSAHVVSCPICRACIHEQMTEDYHLYCDIRKIVPKEIDEGEIYQCEWYKPDEKSIYYQYVKQEIETGKSLE